MDIKAFDDLIISDGSQPLPVLERRVDEWIASRQAARPVHGERGM
jgi:uncharacterized protein (DUF885 family)